MKKGLLMLGVAALALASCTNEEVLNVSDSRAIGFNTFVNNNTKAVTDITTDQLTKFYVFGDYDGGASVAFSNTEVSGTKGGIYTPANPAYWQADKTYTFGAYSNGNGDKLTASYTNGTLTISEYAVEDSKDLIAAIVKDVAAPAANTEQQVALTFKHLLSKVKFTFSTTAVPEAYKMEVSNLKFTGFKTNATCTVNDNVTWTGTNGEYSIATLGDYAVPGDDDVPGGSASTEDILVIPQTNSAIEASFTVTIYDEKTESQIATRNFKASLDCGEWTEGYVYNYTATINPDDVNDQLKPITFTVTKVEEWQPDQEEEIEPTTQP